VPRGNRNLEQVEKALALYKELVQEYGLHLDWMRGQTLADGQKHDQQVAIGLLAVSVYNSAKAIIALYDGQQGESSWIFLRSQFEQAAKAEYFVNHPKRASDFLILEPFERYKLAEGYDEIKKSLRDQIVNDCKAMVKAHPRLLKHQRGKGKSKPDFLAIREALKLPDMQALLVANKWPFELYVTIFLFGSLNVHGSINEMRNYIDQDKDGKVRFQTELDLTGAPDYLLQSANYLFGFIGKIVTLFPPGLERGAEVKVLCDRQKSFWESLKAEPS
jgi:hypothetical protein